MLTNCNPHRSNWHCLAVLSLTCIAIAACQVLTFEKMPLLHPSEAQLHVQANQTLQLSVANQRHQLLTMLSITPEDILVVGLTTTGQRMLSLSYDGSKVHSEFNPNLAGSPPPELIISLLQLAYWPTNSIQNFIKAPFKFQETAAHRYLFHKDDEILRINYIDNINEERRYSPDTHKARGPKSGQSISIFYHPLELQLDIISVNVHPLSSGTRP